MNAEDRARVEETIETRRQLVNDAIGERLAIQRPERLYEASRYLLDAGGKRLRPTLLLLAAEAVDGTPLGAEPYNAFPSDGGEVDVMAAAVSIEVIQSFTLIHDDIMDDDDLRRGVPSVHQQYDVETAILAGDTLYSKAFEYMLETGAEPGRSVRALDRLATTCTQICEGQAFDVEFENRDDVSLEEYMEMVQFKTAVLYAAAASIPAVLLGADEAVHKALDAYGRSIGKAFQIQDDLLDLTTPSEKLGKARGSDLVEGKRTIVTVHAREQGVDVDDLVSDDPTDEQIEAALHDLEAAGSIEYARQTARDLVDRGKERLSVLPESDARARLRGIADYLIEREY